MHWFADMLELERRPHTNLLGQWRRIKRRSGRTGVLP
ncbi:hypothetical protein Nmel_014121 [Mimus melanotis]